MPENKEYADSMCEPRGKAGSEKNPRRRMKLYERIARLCEVEPEAVSSVPIFTIRGRHEIEIDGCRGILEYGGSRVVLSLEHGSFTVIGDSLVLSDFSDRVLVVRGNISSAAFDIGGEGNA